MRACRLISRRCWAARVLEELVFVRLEASTVRTGRRLAREEVARSTAAGRHTDQ